MPAVSNTQIFLEKYTEELTREVIKYPENYVYDKSQVPTIARKMTISLAKGSGNKDSNAIRRTCKALGIPHRYADISRFLNQAALEAANEGAQ